MHWNILHQVDGIPIIIRQNIIGGIALLCQSNRSPLRQPLTSDRRSVAECCKQRFYCSLPANIGVQLFIHQPIDIFKYFPSIDVFLVILCRIRNIKWIATGTVPLRINAVQRKCKNRIDICPQSSLWPCWIDFTGSNIFDVICKWHFYIHCICIRSAQMYSNGFRNIRFSFRHRNRMLLSIIIVPDTTPARNRSFRLFIFIDDRLCHGI